MTEAGIEGPRKQGGSWALLKGAWRAVCGVALLAALTSCVRPGIAPVPAPPVLAADAAHPAQTHGWVETRLYFGLGPADRPTRGIYEADWRAFLDTEVTPRFPSGLSVIDVYGQWQGEGTRRLERLRSKMLVIDHPDTAEIRAKIEAIRAAWKQKTGDQSVLRVTTPVDVSF